MLITYIINTIKSKAVDLILVLIGMFFLYLGSK